MGKPASFCVSARMTSEVSRRMMGREPDDTGLGRIGPRQESWSDRRGWVAMTGWQIAAACASAVSRGSPPQGFALVLAVVSVAGWVWLYLPPALLAACFPDGRVGRGWWFLPVGWAVFLVLFHVAVALDPGSYGSGPDRIPGASPRPVRHRQPRQSRRRLHRVEWRTGRPLRGRDGGRRRTGGRRVGPHGRGCDPVLRGGVRSPETTGASRRRCAVRPRPARCARADQPVRRRRP